MSNRNKVLGYVPKLREFGSIDLKKYRNNTTKKYISIEVSNYVEVGLKIDSLLEVLKRVIINETAVEKISPHCIEDVLEVAHRRRKLIEWERVGIKNSCLDFILVVPFNKCPLLRGGQI